MFQSVRQLFHRRSRADKGFSILCIYNNRQKLNDYLISSLNKQTVPFELLAIDNTKGQLNSAARVLNETARKAKYDHLIFVHQDVELISNFWLANVQRELSTLSRLGAAGVAGNGENGVAASVTHGHPPRLASPKRLDKSVRVQTLDGCLMIVPKKIFERVSFDEETLEGWYLYVVDYCLDLTRLGYRIYVLPHQIYHESTGPGNSNVYAKTLSKIIEKHRNHTKMIYSTVGEWKTR